MHEAVQSNHAPAPIGPYSQAILAGDELFCSGQIPLDPASGEIVRSDAKAQTRQVLANLQAVLIAANFSAADVVKTTIYLIDIEDFSAVNAEYEKVFEASKPARSTVAVAALPRGARVEIDAIAKRRR